MNKIEIKLKELNPDLYSRLETTKTQVELLLQQYSKNFPLYTDHSINHTQRVFNLACDILTKDEIENLNEKELYVLGMASLTHDIGMCIPDEKIKDFEINRK